MSQIGSQVIKGISVILPVYNGKIFLKDNIESVLNQDITDYELLIADDGSNDGSRALLKEIEARKVNNIRVFFHEKNHGLYANLNFLIRKCKYSLIHLWSQDDIMKPNCLRDTIEFHNKYSDISMSYCARDYIDEKGNIINENKIDNTPPLISPNLYANISIRWGCIAGNIANVTLVRDSLEKFGYFDESQKVSGDYEMFTRLAANSDIGFLNKRLVYLRRHENSLSKVDSSIIHFIKEDIPIYGNILNMFEEKERKIADRYWKWKIQVRWMNDFIFLFRRGNYKYSAQVYQLLKQHFNLKGLFLRWIIIRFMRLIKRDRWFYQSLERET